MHTPGPWRYARTNGSPTTGEHMIAGAKPGYLAEVRDCGSGDIQANVRLIVAAPEMLAELKKAHRFLRENGYDMDGINAVMAKVEGV